MSHIVSDQELISQFLEGNHLQGVTQNLKIKVNADSTQLLATWEGIVATIRRIHYTQTISLRANSNYYQLIKAMLVERHFLPVPTQLNPEFEQYQRCQIPEGYKIRYTSVKLLWREWRFTWNERSNNRLRRKILLMSNRNWYPIQAIEFHQGLLIVKTLASTITVQPDEPIIWLNQTHEPPRARIGSKVNTTINEEALLIEDVYPKFKCKSQRQSMLTDILCG